MERFKSQIDESVNFVHEGPFESRYVHRPGADYAICYLSSHTGCNMACRFCHLTQTGQTAMREATLEEVLQQAKSVLEYNKMDEIHFSFMARGEPLENQNLRLNWDEVTSELQLLAQEMGAKRVRFKLSTIMPNSMIDSSLLHYAVRDTEIYYSLYSFNPDFRKRWLPKAMHPLNALKKLSDFQSESGNNVIIHGTYIKGQNDDPYETMKMISICKIMGLKTRFNLVRYNPPDDKSSEADNINTLLALWRETYPESRMIDRVGFDVKASCGMFVEKL